MRSLLLALAIPLLLSSGPLVGHALPTLAVDTDPSAPGVQTARLAVLGEEVVLDLVVLAVETGEPLHAFELDLRFDPTVLTGLSVDLGSFLATPVLPIEAGFAPGVALLAATTLGPEAASGTGVLGSVRLRALAPGSSTLQLESVLLAQPFGIPLGVAGLSGAVLHVVPEPGPVVLLLGGLLLLAGRARRRS